MAKVKKPLSKAESIAERPLRELATIIRSKLAGPFRVTFDIFFNDEDTFRRACASGAITKESLAALYGVPVSRISSLFEVPMANAIKFTMIRPYTPFVGPSDAHGGQQHVPLMNMRIPVGGN